MLMGLIQGVLFCKMIKNVRRVPNERICPSVLYTKCFTWTLLSRDISISVNCLGDYFPDVDILETMLLLIKIKFCQDYKTNKIQ
jgi:hypothetical protein